MFKSDSFNNLEETLQDVVYSSSNKNSSKQNTLNRQNTTVLDTPIPKPVPDFWRPNFISKFINYKPATTK